ncbi:hypothetical protein ABZZ80_12835 [Streptomyces sp. NPDC006356]
MIIGRAHLLLNHSTVFVGSTGFPSDQLDLVEPLESVASSSEHVMLTARQQVAPVSVTLWHRVWPRRGTVVFDGDLTLSDGTLAVFEIDRLSRYTSLIGEPGIHRISVAVDDPGKASRIHVVIDPGEGESAIGSVPGYELTPVSGIFGDSIAPATELGIILSEYDRPVARLVCALKLIFSESPSDVRRKEAINFSRVQSVVEWLRWLHPQISLEYCSELGALIHARLAEGFSDGVDDAAILLAHRVWELIESHPY